MRPVPNRKAKSPRRQRDNTTPPASGNGFADPAHAIGLPPDQINNLLIERVLENLSRLSPRGQRGLLRLLDRWAATDPKERAVLARMAFKSLEEVSDSEIAEMAEVNRTTLYAWPEYKKVKEAMKPTRAPRRGIVNEDGALDAWEAE